MVAETVCSVAFASNGDGDAYTDTTFFTTEGGLTDIA